MLNHLKFSKDFQRNGKKGMNFVKNIFFESKIRPSAATIEKLELKFGDLEKQIEVKRPIFDEKMRQELLTIVNSQLSSTAMFLEKSKFPSFSEIETNLMKIKEWENMKDELKRLGVLKNQFLEDGLWKNELVCRVIYRFLRSLPMTFFVSCFILPYNHFETVVFSTFMFTILAVYTILPSKLDTQSDLDERISITEFQKMLSDLDKKLNGSTDPTLFEDMD